MAVPPDLRGGALPCLLHDGHLSCVQVHEALAHSTRHDFFFLAASVSFLGAGVPPRGERFEEAVSYLERIREHEVHNGEVWSRTSLEPTEGRARLAAARPPSLTRARSAAGVRRDRPLSPDALAEEGAAR